MLPDEVTKVGSENQLHTPPPPPLLVPQGASLDFECFSLMELRSCKGGSAMRNGSEVENLFEKITIVDL